MRWILNRGRLSVSVAVLSLTQTGIQCFSPAPYLNSPKNSKQASLSRVLSQKDTSGFDDTSATSRGIVSVLTALFNTFPSETSSPENCDIQSFPNSPEDLMERIQRDYTIKNYLWTGDIDQSAFTSSCRFTDPTLSFEGTSTFVQNVKNLKPIVDLLTKSTGESICRSDLLDITLHEEYVATHWNMIGNLDALPWKPMIDVVGRTKFWFDESNRVFFYDEEWEIPAGQALLQLITPAGTVSGRNRRSM